MNEKGKEYSLIGEYDKAKTKTKFRHNVCGYTWETAPNTILASKRGCPKCSGNARRTTDSFKEEVHSLVGNEYNVIGEYENARTKIRIEHETCGKSYEVTPDSFINLGTRCPICAGNIRWTNEKFLDEVRNRVGDEYIFKDEYENNSTPLRCLHVLCGYEWHIPPASFLDKNTRCPNCAGNAARNTETYRKEVEEIYGEEYKIIGEYKNNITGVLTRHKCGNEWVVRPSNLLRGRRCPRCYRESNGEMYVRGILEREEVVFEPQKAFDGCRYKNPLPFDFYLPELNTAIEYDGEQHFRPVNFGGDWDKAKERFKQITLRDNIKNTYCEENGINLIRIPYYLSEEEIDKLITGSIRSQEVTQRVLNQN